MSVVTKKKTEGSKSNSNGKMMECMKTETITLLTSTTETNKVTNEQVLHWAERVDVCRA